MASQLVHWKMLLHYAGQVNLSRNFEDLFIFRMVKYRSQDNSSCVSGYSFHASYELVTTDAVEQIVILRSFYKHCFSFIVISIRSVDTSYFPCSFIIIFWFFGIPKCYELRILQNYQVVLNSSIVVTFSRPWQFSGIIIIANGALA